MSEQNGASTGGSELTPREKQARAIAVVVDEFSTVPQHLLMTDHLDMMVQIGEQQQVIAGLEAVRPSPGIVKDWNTRIGVNNILADALMNRKIKSMFGINRHLGGAFGKAYMESRVPEYWRRAHDHYQRAFELAETPIETGTVLVDRIELNVFNFHLGGDGLKNIESDVHLAEGCVLDTKEIKALRKAGVELNERIEGVMAANSFQLHPVTGNLYVAGNETEAAGYIEVGAGEVRLRTPQEIEASIAHLVMTRGYVPTTGTSKATEKAIEDGPEHTQLSPKQLGAAMNGAMAAAEQEHEVYGWDAPGWTQPNGNGHGYSHEVGGWGWPTEQRLGADEATQH